MSVDTSDALSAALWMASHGYQIWPCRIQLRPNKKGELKKEPDGLPKSWTARGLIDPAEIRARFSAVRATGYMVCCGPSGITGVDLDQHGIDGRASWHLQGGTLDANFMVRTPTGGEHLYYASGGSGNKSNVPLGIDIRGVTGGLFGPGSVVLDEHGQPVGTYYVISGSPAREQLTPEPVTITASVGARRETPLRSEADQFFAQTGPIRKSQVIKTANKMIAQVRDMRLGETDSMKLTIMRAAYTIGGLLDANLFTYEQARDMILKACEHVFGEADDDDIKWTDYGLDTGVKKPLVIYDDIQPEGSNPLDTEATTQSNDRIVDLTPYLDGTYNPPEPSVGAKRSDGVQLMYPSRWHTVVGLTEAGKSLFAIWQSVAVIRAGGAVVYLHFEESDVRGTLERLRNFGRADGLDDETIRKQFIWMNCETRWAEGDFAQALSRLPGSPALVVLDGVNAATAQHGGDVMRPEAVEQYKRLFVTPATSSGAAVLSLGHPVKDRTRQGERHSFGSTAWLDVVDGVAFRLVASSKPITRGRSGSSALSVVKDRYGSVKRHGEPDTRKEAGWFFLGSFVVDDAPPEGSAAWRPEYSDHGTSASLRTAGPKKQVADGLQPGDSGEGAEDDSAGEQPDSQATQDDTAVLALVGKLLAEGKTVNKRALHAHAGIAKDRVDNATQRLADNGKIQESTGARGAKIYSFAPSQVHSSLGCRDCSL